jgi:hypothetical protein
LLLIGAIIWSACDILCLWLFLCMIVCL